MNIVILNMTSFARQCKIAKRMRVTFVGRCVRLQLYMETGLKLQESRGLVARLNDAVGESGK